MHKDERLLVVIHRDHSVSHVVVPRLLNVDDVLAQYYEAVPGLGTPLDEWLLERYQARRPDDDEVVEVTEWKPTVQAITDGANYDGA